MHCLSPPSADALPGRRLGRSLVGHGSLRHLRPDRGERGHQLRVGRHAAAALPSAAAANIINISLGGGEEEEEQGVEGNLPADDGGGGVVLTPRGGQSF